MEFVDNIWLQFWVIFCGAVGLFRQWVRVCCWSRLCKMAEKYLLKSNFACPLDVRAFRSGEDFADIADNISFKFWVILVR